MPEAVQSWVDSGSIEAVERILKQIVTSYENDFAKHAPVRYFPKLSAVWEAIPTQLAKENRKFIFSRVRQGWRAKDLEEALDWLSRAGLVHKVLRIEKPHLPLSSYADHSHFKLYMCDVGLLRSVANLPASVILDGGDGYREFKGAMAENYVCCELAAMLGEATYYWTAEGSGRAEVDFVVQDGASIVPIEVKAGRAGQARSLGEYRKKFGPERCVLTALDGGRNDFLPLYAFWRLKDWLAPPVSAASPSG